VVHGYSSGAPAQVAALLTCQPILSILLPPQAAPVLADAAKLKVIVDRTPLGRIATAPEVAGVMAFLCLPVAGYVTGQSLCVDGGFTVNGNHVY
jgi:NAD(P)-dependent dehydrogenase (short-subunit alcohol dehydrogenase family)